MNGTTTHALCRYQKAGSPTMIACEYKSQRKRFSNFWLLSTGGIPWQTCKLLSVQTSEQKHFPPLTATKTHYASMMCNH